MSNLELFQRKMFLNFWKSQNDEAKKVKGKNGKVKELLEKLQKGNQEIILEE